MSRAIFVFGSNLAGRHGKGAAKEALTNWGAIYGQGVGLQGNSYAIPTKGYNLETLPLFNIRNYIGEFIYFARDNQDMLFIVTPVGCGLAGHDPIEIAPMFKEYIPPNVYLPREFV